MRLGRSGNEAREAGNEMGRNQAYTDICTYLHSEAHLTGGQEAMGITREGMGENVVCARVKCVRVKW